MLMGARGYFFLNSCEFFINLLDKFLYEKVKLEFLNTTFVIFLALSLYVFFPFSGNYCKTTSKVLVLCQ